MENRHSTPTPLGSFISSLAILALAVGPLSGAGGVIYYNAVPTENSPAQLRRINGDGSGDQAIAVPLKEAAVPSVARDGRRVLITSRDPNRPFKISQNVYSLDLANGAISPVTAFEDFVNRGSGLIVATNGVLENPNDPLVSAYTTHLPNYKAYSPDSTRVAVFNFAATSGTLQNTDGTLKSFGASSPTLSLHTVGSPNPLGILVQPGAERTFTSHGGDGVDWHPTREEIVAPFRVNIPTSGSAGVSLSEGTVLAIFATDGRPKPFLRNLTSPTGINDISFEDFSSVAAAQNDYAPAISPNGLRVAYVRNTIRFDSRISLAPLRCLCTLRTIQYDGSDDREILALPEGVLVSRATWSPDGSEIAFDVAPQLSAQGGNYYLIGDATRSEIGIIRSDGTNLRTLAGPPASSPSWAADVVTAPPLKPSVQMTRVGSELAFSIGNLTIGRSVEIESTADFQKWTLAQKFSSSAAQQEVRLANPPGPGHSFFRVLIR